MFEFRPFQKIYRFWEQPIVVTEKIDGTNAQITITEDGEFLTGSRNRLITPEDDNFGFSRWAWDNKEELMKLGPGTHYGEWWGKGIQHGYGLSHKVFSLFNTHRWSDDTLRPACCDVVPVVLTGYMPDYLRMFPNHSVAPKVSLAALKYGVECPEVEGLMIYFVNSKTYMKHLVQAAPKQKGTV